MTGVVERMPSSKRNKTAAHRRRDGVHVIADGDSDEHDVNETERDRHALPKNMSGIQCGDIPLRSWKMPKKKKKKKKKKGFSVASESASSSRIPVDLMCSQFPTDTNSAVGVDVSCGAMNPFSNEVPYNSAGLSLAHSLDTNPGGFLSQNTRRRRRPTLISTMSASSLHSNNSNESVVRRRLMTSTVNIPNNSRRSGFRSSFPSVERFNYAKALLRSDHELEKLSQKIRSEINESELFELAQAAEKAAELGQDNFSGRASTFGGELQSQQQKGSTNNTTGLFVTTSSAPLTRDNATVDANLAQASKVGQLKSRQFTKNENTIVGRMDGHNSPIAFSEQSLLEHARAAAAAVVVAAPTVQLKTAQRKMRKEPEIRSMRIDSLRDVNEVIPQWKEVHGHMRTHFYRANVNSDSLFFCETESSPTASNSFSKGKINLSPDSSQAKEKNNGSNHRRAKSFFDNIKGIKLLPDFRPKKSSHQRGMSMQLDNVSEKKNTKQLKQIDTVRVGEFGTTLSSHLSPKEKEFDRIQSPILCVPPGLAHPDIYKKPSARFENQHDRDRQSTSLTPRLPKREESFDSDVLQIEKNVNVRSQRLSGCRNIEKYYDDDDDDDDDDFDDGGDDNGNDCDLIEHTKESPPGHRYQAVEGESTSSSPEGMRDSSIVSLNYGSPCPASPSNDSILQQLSPRLGGPSLSPAAPSTPKNRTIARRKESGFSTPAHLRLIKRLGGSVHDEKTSRTMGDVKEPNSEEFKDFGLHDETYMATPANAVYSHFEPNSIVKHSPERSDILATPALEHIETTHLTLPTIQSSKSKNDLQKISRNLVRRKLRTQWQNCPRSPPDSPTISTEKITNTVLSASNHRNGFDSEVPHVADSVLGLNRNNNKTEEYIAVHDSKSLSSSKLMSCINPPHDISSLKPLKVKLSSSMMHDNSHRDVGYDKAVDEKKECDSANSSFDPISQNGIDEPQPLNAESELFALNLKHGENVDKKDDLLRQHLSPEAQGEISMLMKTTDGISGVLPAMDSHWVTNQKDRTTKLGFITRTKAREMESLSVLKGAETVGSSQTVESNDFLSMNSIRKDDVVARFNHASDTSIGDNLSVCHSLPSTDVNFKAAVQTVQGVAVQTVQEVFSHLSLGSPRSNENEWESEGDNKEFLSNYFYYAKAKDGNDLHASSSKDNIQGLTPSETNLEGLACTEPCNGRDSPCYMFGIDTMCGGLIELIPNDVQITSTSRNQRRQGSNGVFSTATIRDRSSSISMGQIRHGHERPQPGINSLQGKDEGTWLSIFQRVASERFNIQFQTEDNALEKSRHPYTPPYLSRKVSSRNQICKTL